MLESKTKTITKFILIISGVEVPFTTKELCIRVGIMAYKINSQVKMIERITMWNLSAKGSSIIMADDFDRTILLYTI